MKKENLAAALERLISGRGFYVIVALCALVIGVSLWFIFSVPEEAETPKVTINSPVVTPREPETDTVSEPEPEDDIVPDVSETVQSGPEPDTETTASVSEPPELSWPLSGETITQYAADYPMFDQTMGDWRTHPAIDIAADIGAQVSACADGTVAEVFEDDLLGVTVIVEHAGGIRTVYANLAETPAVQPGETVYKGDAIGTVGSTADGESAIASHLHFAVEKDGAADDPSEYLPQ